ncbi:CBS domain-containing protein [Streptomyces sp. NBC_01171]|uniref:CBS domain-containing protein n=1 Tax=Streptomyces sp. NBC_01171 TaxID=2903757 RepID=UPI00386AC8DB|nr:CBS domain-containing protein [Streptomyces sp. NBC_01171]
MLGTLDTRSVSARPVRGTVVDVVNAAGPQVWYDMTVEVALSVMAAARTQYLLVCDEDGQCVGLVTQSQLTAVRDSIGYTDRVRLGDITHSSEPSVSPWAAGERAENGVPFGRLGPVPVVDERGNALGVLARSR